MVVELGVTLNTTEAADQTSGGDLFRLLDPMAFLLEQTGGTGPIWDFYCAGCSRWWGAQYINLTEVCGQPTPTYPCNNASGVGVYFGDYTGYGDSACDFGWQWLYSLWWSIQCGEPEGDCTDYSIP